MKMTNLLVILILLLKKSEATRQKYSCSDFDAVLAIFNRIKMINTMATLPAKDDIKKLFSGPKIAKNL
jgi:hypothetical protein